MRKSSIRTRDSFRRLADEYEPAQDRAKSTPMEAREKGFFLWGHRPVNDIGVAFPMEMRRDSRGDPIG